MKKNMPLLAIVLLLGYGFASKQYTGFGADSIQLLPADSTENCCDGATARYDQIDSVEFFIGPLSQLEEEEALPTRQALENLRVKRAEIQQNNRIKALYKFPKNAIVFEYAAIASPKGRAIAIVLENPHINLDPSNIYVCPSTVSGFGSFCGKPRFLLLDTLQKRIIDTLNYEFSNDNEWSTECLDLPFALNYANSYFVDDTFEQAHLPHVLHFSDFNKDGIAAEFPLFQYVACGWNNAAIVGYDSRTDQLVQFLFELKVHEADWQGNRNGKDSVYTITYVDMPNLHLETLAKKGRLRYDFYGGHGMEVASKFDVHFDKTGGKFVGKERMLAADKLFGGKAPWIGY